MNSVLLIDRSIFCQHCHYFFDNATFRLTVLLSEHTCFIILPINKRNAYKKNNSLVSFVCRVFHRFDLRQHCEKKLVILGQISIFIRNENYYEFIFVLYYLCICITHKKWKPNFIVHGEPRSIRATTICRYHILPLPTVDSTIDRPNFSTPSSCVLPSGGGRRMVEKEFNPRKDISPPL